MSRPISTLSIHHHHHHRHHSSTSSPMLASAIATSGMSQPTHQHMSHVDRDSAIALGSIVFLILALTAYTFFVKIKKRRQKSMRRQVDEQRRDNLSDDSVVGNKETKTGTVIFKMNSLWSKAPVSRQDSVSTTAGSDDEQGMKNPSPATFSSHSSPPAIAYAERAKFDTTLHTVDHRPLHTRERSASPLPCSNTASISHYAPSPPPPIACRHSRHRRTSSIHSVPIAIVAEQRRASLSQIQNDKRWWDDVARRGSTSHADRRSSGLEPILEPGIAHGICGMGGEV